jgi:hypothetical protein
MLVFFKDGLRRHAASCADISLGYFLMEQKTYNYVSISDLDEITMLSTLQAVITDKLGGAEGDRAVLIEALESFNIFGLRVVPFNLNIKVPINELKTWFLETSIAVHLNDQIEAL